jgi:hypothetical protein
MAVEAKRGCGYRKVGGLYLVGGGIGVPCDRLPIPLTVCPCCGQGIKQSRGWTWVDVNKLVEGPHQINKSDFQLIGGSEVRGCWSEPCLEMEKCILCGHPETLGKAGLLWIGAQFYKTPEEFIVEGRALGFSRRIRTVPRGFKSGETWVLLAHPNAIETWETDTDADVEQNFPLTGAPQKQVFKPGIFYLWRPERLEKIVSESERGSEEIQDLEKRGITPVFVPDDDADHQGSVFDKQEELFTSEPEPVSL